MTPEDFAAALDKVVRAGAEGFLRYLDAPAGRTPPQNWVSLSAWFHDLSEADRAAVTVLVHEAAVATAHTICSVLDGTVTIEARGPKGRLVLAHVAPDGTVATLNDPETPFLADLYATIQESA